MRTLLAASILLGMLLSAASAAGERQDLAALRALDQAYAEEWISGNHDGVMALFTEDATLVPHHGDAPVKGRNSIRRFWFNPEYPPTTVPEWQRTPAELFVEGDIGVVRGRSRLIWEYGQTRTTIPEGNYVMIAVREGGRWLIRLLTWNDDPREWLQESIE